MKKNMSVADVDVLNDVGKTDNNIPVAETSIHEIDPFIQPLVDTNELSTKNESRHEELVRLDRSQANYRASLFSQNLRRCTGIMYALIGSSLFTSSGFIIKQLRVDFFDALLCRFIIQTSILTAFILYKRYKILTGSTDLILLQITRVILAVCGLLFFYSSYRYIPLPDLTTFRYTQVIWTAILAMIIFRERISIPTVLAIIFTLIGVVCVAQPTFLFGNQKKLSTSNESRKSHRILGLVLALLCALSISGSIVLNKKLLVLKIPQSVLMFHFSCLTLIILIGNQLRNRFILHAYSNHTMFTWRFAIAASVSLLQLLSSTLTQKAIKLEHPSIISVVQSSDILFALLLQNLITNEKSNWLVLLGSGLVTASIFLVGIHKLWKDQKALVVEQTREENVKV